METPDIQISLSVLAKIMAFDLAHPGKETAGLLIGQDIDGIVHIDEMRVGDQQGNAVHVEISDHELTMAAIEVSEREDGKVIVGWWHTHPSLSAFLSGTDIRTQSLYQAFMHNAVAIVIDDVKYSETFNLNDLDLGVFRVQNSKAVKQNYIIKDAVEFGLQAFIRGDNKVEVSSSKPNLYIPIIDADRLEDMRFTIKNLEGQLNEQDFNAFTTWIELMEATLDGSIKEVPVDMKRISLQVEDSLERLDETLLNLEDRLFNKEATVGMFSMMVIVVLEFLFFWFVLKS